MNQPPGPGGVPGGGPGGYPSGAEPCAEKAGFLFSHHCRRPSAIRCPQCSRPVCDRHQIHTDSGPMCINCGKKASRKAGRRRGRGHDHDHDHDYSPYFYSSYYYDNYGYYGQGSWAHGYYDSSGPGPHDFSEADGASLRSGADWDNDFEHDMGAS